MRVFVKPNLTDLNVVPCDAPWDLAPTKWPEGTTKANIRKAWATPSFRGSFLHGFEGMSAGIAVSKEAGNLPVKMHTLIVDYDSKITDSHIDGMLRAPATEMPPAWVARTSGGGARLYWEFEKAVTIASPAQAQSFLAQLSKRLYLKGWLPGLDTNVMTPYQCFELGSRWQRVSEYVIPSMFLHQWLFESSQRIKLLQPGEKSCAIPIGALAEEVSKRFPGRWEGEFDLGRRGVRFWDPTADNPTAAIVCEDGMLCFTGPSGFVSWRTIFGGAFVEQYEAKRIEAAMENVLWDEKNYWVKQDDGHWERWSSDSFKSWLKCQGFSGKPEKAGLASEIDEVLVEIQARRRVRGALPFLYWPHGPIVYRDENVLNISRVRPIQPAQASFDTIEDAFKTFPFIWSFLSNFLALVDGRPVQLTYLLSWMKHFYESGLYQRPQPCHAVVLAGDMSKGKTFFTTGLLSRLMGGCTDGSEYIVRGSQWTDQMAKWPVLTVDDDEHGSSPDAHQKFSALVKKLVANQSLSFNGKWQATGQVDWNGRIVICCNDDPESLRMLPNLDHGTLDKLSLLLVAKDSPFVFPADRQDITRRVEAELPFFARFLLDFKVPEAAIDRKNTRFFLLPYRHPGLCAHANRGGATYTTFELIASFLDEYRVEFADRTTWEGSAIQLFKCLAQRNQPGALGRLTPRALGVSLGQLTSRGVGVRSVPDGHGIQRWVIPVDIEWSDNAFSQERGSVASLLQLKNTEGEGHGRTKRKRDGNTGANLDSGPGGSEIQESKGPAAGSDTGAGGVELGGKGVHDDADPAHGEGPAGSRCAEAPTEVSGDDAGFIGGGGI